MTMTSSLFGVLLALFAPGQPAPPPDHPVLADFDVPLAAAPLCAISVQGPGRRVTAIVKAQDGGFKGRAHLHLAGQGFLHEDLRPVRIAAGTDLALPVPSVPMPKRLSGELKVLDTKGDTVCVARL